MTAAAGRTPSVLIVAGGTGGHVYPALAVASHLRERGARVSWLGTTRGLEVRVAPAAGFPFFPITVGGLRGKGLRTLAAAPLVVLRAVFQSLRVMRRVRPDAVLGMGGFAAGPGGLAAWLLRRPLLIHEQNAVPGLTNRLLAPLARVVMEAFPHSFRAGVGAVATGNPLREDFTGAARPAPREPLRVLVVGGSLGAKALNEVVPEALARVAADHRLAVRHQSGPAHHESTAARYASLGLAAEVLPYVEDMAAAYRWADLAVCRAGAMTVAELAASALPAVLIPFPHAVDDHQTANARYLVEAGGALLMPQRDLTAAALAARITGLLDAPGRLAAIAGPGTAGCDAGRGRALPGGGPWLRHPWGTPRGWSTARGAWGASAASISWAWAAPA